MSALYDPNGTFWSTTTFLTNYVTGNIYLTFLIYVVLAVAILVLFQVGAEWAAVLLSLLIIVLMAVSGDWLAAGGMILFFLAAIVTKKFVSG